jgi:hypothetical protein
MTVPSTPRSAGPFTGTGALVSYPFGFKVFSGADVRVTATDTSGNESDLVLDSTMLVSLNADQDSTPGGSVQYASSGVATALPAGYVLAINGEALEFAQTADLPQGGNFNPTNLENALDRLQMQLLILQEQLARSVKLPLSDVGDAITLPNRQARLSKVWACDANGDLVFTVPAAGTADALALDLIDDTGAGNGAGMSGYGAAVTYANGTIGAHVANFINVDADYDTDGTGAIDDNVQINAACARALLTGATVVFNGLKTYAIGTQWAIPAGLKVRTNGAVFRDLNGTASTSPLVTIAAGAHLDRLNVDIPTGKTRKRGVLFTGTTAETRVDGFVTVTYADQQTGAVNDDAAVRISAAAMVRLGGVRVTNHDRPVQAINSTDFDVGGVFATSYVRGLLIENCTNWYFGRSRLSTASPNASYTPGHVGVLIQSATTDATRNGTLENFVIEDAGEHGMRFGGPERISNVLVVNPRVKNCGGSGIKILGTDSGTPTATNDQIVIVNPIIEDCGTGGLTSNMCGLLLMFCTNVTVIGPIIKKTLKLQSGYAGIRIAGATNLVLDSPNVADASTDGIFIDNSLGDNTKIVINGGLTASNVRDGFRITTGGLNAVRRVVVDGLVCDGNGAYGANIAIGAATAVDGHIRIKTHNNTTDAIACDSTAFHIDVVGLVTTPPTAANSSVIRDLTNTKIRGGGVWHTLALP